MELGTAVTTVKGDAITVADVILHLKAKGTFRTAIYEIIEQKVVEYKLQEYGVALPQVSAIRALSWFAKRAILSVMDADGWTGESMVAGGEMPHGRKVMA